MNIKVRFTENARIFAVKVAESAQNFTAKLGQIQTVTEYIGGEKYEGEYVVTPKVEAQSMATKGKVMVNDITIKSIPFFNVSNTVGGSTVYIGSEV